MTKIKSPKIEFIVIFFLLQINCFSAGSSFTTFQNQVNKLSVLRLITIVFKSAQKCERHFIVLKHFSGGLRNHVSTL